MRRKTKSRTGSEKSSESLASISQNPAGVSRNPADASEKLTKVSETPAKASENAAKVIAEPAGASAKSAKAPENATKTLVAVRPSGEDTAADTFISRPWRHQLRRRMRIVIAAVSILMMGLAFRVYSIQMVEGDEYKAMAQSQQKVALSGVDDRGTIYDRNGQALTGARAEYVYILPKGRLDENAEGLIEQLKALGGRERRTSNEKYRIVTSERCEKEISKELRQNYGAYVLQVPQRYEADQTAAYLLGYVRSADGVGMTGLERAFDDWLSQRDKVVYGVADAANLILPGYGVQNSKERTCCLFTTLDRSLQKKVEQVVNRVEEGRCCAIITEVESGDILACATAPGYDPLQVEELLASENQELLDIALQGQYPPGSVFKIVVAAAALESGACTPNQEFICTGAQKIGDVTIACTAKQGHGTLTMEEAFAQSCNCAFIQMGQQTGAAAILDMAEKLGLGSSVLKGLEMDRTGNLMSESEAVGAGIGNLSIGQGTLLVTPLQVAQLTQTVANGGVFTGLYLADAQKDDDGLQKLPRDAAQSVVRKETADALLSMMRRTVAAGTASRLKDWDCGGKTGSAEGVFHGQETVHAWFTGVVPAENPRFSVTVFVENGGSGGKAAVPVFEEIMEQLE